ncbi:hypothetical protein Hypma_001327 [Hypsizygus marmoreus]|uniref:Uncharacterized protein n=1 Tax=Hypsizygus marmoreus TaxID=39966 RepID=A0A369K129_HYPMA|nr:hypothetical protein Hypma_001327 [Hypsizygus marmoreus]
MSTTQPNEPGSPLALLNDIQYVRPSHVVDRLQKAACAPDPVTLGNNNLPVKLGMDYAHSELSSLCISTYPEADVGELTDMKQWLVAPDTTKAILDTAKATHSLNQWRKMLTLSNSLSRHELGPLVHSIYGPLLPVAWKKYSKAGGAITQQTIPTVSKANPRKKQKQEEKSSRRDRRILMDRRPDVSPMFQHHTMMGTSTFHPPATDRQTIPKGKTHRKRQKRRGESAHHAHHTSMDHSRPAPGVVSHMPSSAPRYSVAGPSFIRSMNDMNSRWPQSYNTDAIHHPSHVLSHTHPSIPAVHGYVFSSKFPGGN